MPVTVRVVVLFPFTLGNDQNENERILDTLKMTLDVVQGAHPSIELHNCHLAPILFVNRISEKRGYFSKIEEFLSGERHAGRWRIVYGWSVDTCQDWLHAWGTVIDEW